MEAEAEILTKIRLALPAGCRLFRQTVGSFFTRTGQPVFVGMKGTPDLVGYTTVRIGERDIAVYTCIEVKNESGRVSEQQQMFLDAVKRAGGIAGVARSVEDAQKIIREYRP